MGRKRHSRQLKLFMNGELVGTWGWLPDGQELLYAESWLASPRGRPLSLSLPFQPGNVPLRSHLVQLWFENLLPDSREIRERMASRFRASSISAFDLLAEIGRDCVGALQIVPEDENPGDVHTIRGEELSDAEVARELATVLGSFGGRRSNSNSGLRISLAGAQEKTALLRHRGRWLRPVGATPTSHILKLSLGLVGAQQIDLRHSVENEWLCSRIIDRYGLPIARCEMATFGEFRTLIVERFDRVYAADGSWVIRLPQEDLCQATGTAPEFKYEADGGPGIDRILDLLRTSNQGERDRRNFLKSQLLFWMLSAPDGHAKNFSIALNAGGAFELTPLYDVMSFYPLLGSGVDQVSPHDLKLAMAVRSENPHWKMKEILPRHWQAVARRNALGGVAEALIAELAEATPRVVSQVAGELPADFPVAISEPILHGLEKAAQRLALG